MAQDPMSGISRMERRAFILVALVAFTYVLLRAILVPWVNDEALTLLLYVEPNDFLPFKAHWDANNHFLNSWLMSLAHGQFGLSHLGSRLGNVLAFLLYAWATYRLGSRVEHGFVRWCLWLALLLCPMLVELFAFARGYGMATAFWLGAAVWLMRLVETWSLRVLLLALLLLFLANAAVLAAVPVWAAVLALIMPLWIHYARSNERWWGALAWLILGVLPLTIAMKYSLDLRALGGFYIGSSEGFVSVTVASLLKQLIGSDSLFLGWTVSLFMLVAMVYVLLRGRNRPVLLVPVVLLGADVLSRLLMARLMNVNFPNDRAVAHLVPWVVVTGAFALDQASLRAWIPYTAVLFLWLPLWTILNVDLRSSVLWGYQSPPEGLVRRVVSEQADGLKLLGGPDHIFISLALEARRLGLEAVQVENDDPSYPWQEQRILIGRENAIHETDFRIIDSVASTGHYLVERLTSYGSVVDLEWTTGVWEGPVEFMELLNSDTLLDGEDRVVDIEGPIDSDGAHRLLNLDLTMRGSDGSDVYFERYSIDLLRPRWRGEHLRLRVRIPPVHNALNRKIYIWNVRKEPLRAGPFKVTVRRLEK